MDGKLLEYNKAAPRADYAYIDYGLGHYDTERCSRAIQRTSRSILRRLITGCR